MSNNVLALVGMALFGATLAAAPTIPADVPWYVHTALAFLQGGAGAVLLIVDPAALGLFGSRRVDSAPVVLPVLH